MSAEARRRVSASSRQDELCRDAQAHTPMQGFRCRANSTSGHALKYHRGGLPLMGGQCRGADEGRFAGFPLSPALRRGLRPSLLLPAS